MSFDEYVNNTIQKHRLAVSLAVLKAKPEEIHINQYLKDLKDIINNKMDTCSITSDDFNVDDENYDQTGCAGDHLAKGIVYKNTHHDQTNTTPTPNAEIANEVIKLPQTEAKIVQTDGECSNNIVQMCHIDDLTNIDTSNSIVITDPNVIRILSQKFANFDSNLVEIRHTKDHNDVNMDDDVLNNDLVVSEGNTSIDLLNGFDLEDIEGDNNLMHFQDHRTNPTILNNQISDSENWNIFEKNNEHENRIKMAANICKNLNKAKQPDTNNCCKTVTNVITNDNNNIRTSPIDVSTHIKYCAINKTKTDINIDYDKTNKEHNKKYFCLPSTSKENAKVVTEYAKNNADNIHEIHNNMPDINQNTEITCTENYTHVSQSQTPKIIPDIYIKGKRKYGLGFDGPEIIATNEEKSTTKCKDPDVGCKHRKVDIETCTDMNTDVFEEVESTEVISFKVLEEINTIKKYLARRGETEEGSDSGYKSDSMSRSSYKKVSQTSTNSLNQSAYHLMRYLYSCQLIEPTHDVNNEISEVLAKLIDSLYEQEVYPSFLEDLFENINQLLTDLHVAKSDGVNDLLNRDEITQRLCLLNYSVHILEFTIEKITDILEKTYEQTIIETYSEISDIDKIENIAYLLHLLEIFIKKYLRNRDVLTQNSSQNSQESEKLYKKSTISDIWRRKWNPTRKEEPLSNNTQKNVLAKCNEVLNKYIVDFMNSYSLIAYTALQCFNLLQK